MTAFPKPTKANRLPKPLRRRKPLRKKRARRIDRQTPEDRRYLSWIHTQPCSNRSVFCDGAIQAAHLRDGTGMGRKEPDETCIPLCRSHHEQYDQARGSFIMMTRDERKAWHRRRQAEARSLYEASEGREG